MITDSTLLELIAREETRQQDCLTLIPSENHTSPAVLATLGTVLSDKYAEGYPGRRYYGGNRIIDEIEKLTQERAKSLFGVPYVNVQPYSGSPANFAVYLATCQPGDAFMGLSLLDGGHLTHGWKYSATSLFWKSVPYHVKPDGTIDLEEVRRLAIENKPKLIWCGGTAIPRTIPFAEFAKIADEVGAYLVADISHISGLVVAGAHPSPVEHVHIVTTTTHKTLRGPRGALIMVTAKGLAKTPDLGEKIDKAIIPGLQGGPHMNTIAGIGTALFEAATPEFRTYAHNVVANAKTLAEALKREGFTLASDGTDNHLILVDLSPTGVGRGLFLEQALEAVGLVANRNTVPGDKGSAIYPSGVRMGTPAVTSRGMGAAEMEQIAKWIGKVAEHVKTEQMPTEKTERAAAIARFRGGLVSDPFYAGIREEVQGLCRRFPVPGLRK